MYKTAHDCCDAEYEQRFMKTFNINILYKVIHAHSIYKFSVQTPIQEGI